MTELESIADALFAIERAINRNTFQLEDIKRQLDSLVVVVSEIGETQRERDE